MAGSTAELLIRIRADMASATKQINDLDKQLKGLGGTTTTSSAGFGAMAKSGAGMALGFAGVTTAAAGVYMLGSTIKDGIDTAAGFEKQMSAVKAVSAATDSDMKTLASSALQLGPAWGMGGTEVGRGMEELVKAGISVQDVTTGAAQGALTLARAGGVDMATAAMVGANAINLFNLKGTDMAHVADMAAGAANATVISVQDYAMSFQQASAAMALANQTFDDTTVAIAMMGQAGIKNSDAGTSLKTMFLSLAPTTKMAKDEMERLGLIVGGQNQFFDAATGKAKSYRDIAQLLQTALKDLNTEQQTMSLQLIFGSDAYRAAAVAAKAGASGVDTMMAAIQQTSAYDVAKTKMDNFAGSMDKLGASWETFNVRTGGGALPGLKGFADWLTGALTATNNANAVIADHRDRLDELIAKYGGAEQGVAALMAEHANLSTATTTATGSMALEMAAASDLADSMDTTGSKAWTAATAQYGFATATDTATTAVQGLNDAMKDPEARRGFVFGGQEADRVNAEKEKLMKAMEASDLANDWNKSSPFGADVLKTQGANMIADWNTAQDKIKSDKLKAVADAARAITDGINQAKQALQNFAQTPLTGETAMSDQMFALDQQIAQKERDLLALKGQRGMGRQMSQTQKELDDLKKQRQLLGYDQTLTYAPQHRLLDRLANPVTEMSVEDAQAGILSEWAKLGILGPQSKEPVQVGTVQINMNGVTGENLVEKAQTAAEELLAIIQNARTTGGKYQGAAQPQLSGAGG